MSIFFNRVKVATATTGQGTLALGAAVAKFCTPDEAGVANAQEVTYLLEEGNDFEVGRGIYTTSGATLTRATVLLSKIAGAAGTTKMTLLGGATCAITAGAEDLGRQGIGSLSFGAFPGGHSASLVITGQPAIRSTSAVRCWIQPAATADHSIDEHTCNPPSVFAGNIVAGTGFTIYGASHDTSLFYGAWNVGWRWE